jgi:hypothetical protein
VSGVQFGILVAFAAMAAIVPAFEFGRFGLFVSIFVGLLIIIMIGDAICEAVKERK